MKTNAAFALKPAHWTGFDFNLQRVVTPMTARNLRNTPAHWSNVKRQDDRAIRKALRAAEQAAWDASSPRVGGATTSFTPEQKGIFPKAFEAVLFLAVGLSAAGAVAYAATGTTSFAAQIENLLRLVLQALG